MWTWRSRPGIRRAMARLRRLENHWRLFWERTSQWKWTVRGDGEEISSFSSFSGEFSSREEADGERDRWRWW